MPVLPFGDRRPALAPDVFVAEGAYIIGDVTIGAGSSVWYNAVIRGDIAPIRIGRGSNVQDGSVLHVDEGVPCVVGDGVVIGHVQMSRAWIGTDEVLALTQKTAATLGLRTALLPVWRDVDTIEDVEALIDACAADVKKPKNEQSFSSRTAGALQLIAKRLRTRA